MESHIGHHGAMSTVVFLFGAMMGHGFPIGFATTHNRAVSHARRAVATPQSK
jgi:hypothetical protein